MLTRLLSRISGQTLLIVLFMKRFNNLADPSILGQNSDRATTECYPVIYHIENLTPWIVLYNVESKQLSN